MYLIVLFNLLAANSFNIQHKLIPTRITRLNNNDNNDKLRKIDHKLNIEKLRLKKLLVEKNEIMKNMTGLDLHNETFINDYMENINNENIYDNYDEDGFNNEYDFEFKPRPKIKYNTWYIICS